MILKLIIKLYWIVVPKNKRRKCLFSTSCSHHVYNTLRVRGPIAAWKELYKRFLTCRPGYKVICINENEVVLLLRNGECIRRNEISPFLFEDAELL
jgi:hypothetical protein